MTDIPGESFYAISLWQPSDDGETPEQCARRLRWPQREFAALWDSIHGPAAWEANPWVVAIEFKPELRNIDAGGRE